MAYPRPAHAFTLLLAALLTANAGQTQIALVPQAAALALHVAASNNRISGRIVSAVDGHPLAGAAVTLTDIKTRRAELSGEADSEGRFHFDNLPAGKFSLNGAQRGYLPGSYQQHEQFSTAIVMGAGLATEALVLELAPLALISGHVMDEAGDPVRNATITLYRENHGTGTARIAQTGGAVTDDLGAYELAGIRPGRFFVAVQAAPWYATHPRSRNQGVPFTGSVDPALDVAYPLTFHPGTANSDEATPIVLRGGERLTIDLHLTPVHAVTLTLPAPAPPTEGQPYQAPPQLQRTTFGITRTVPVPETETAGTTVTLYGLAPGSYQLNRFNPANGRTSGTTNVDLRSGSATVGSVEGTPSTNVAVTVHDASGSAFAADAQVLLRSGEPQRAVQAQLDPKGRAELTDVSPGRYRLSVFGSGHAYHAVSIVLNGTTLPSNTLQIAPGQQLKVDLTVSSNFVSVQGTAHSARGSSGGAMVVLAPVAADTPIELFRRDQTDLDGTFSLSQVVPGDYIVVAIDDGWKLDWGKMDVLAPYLTKGVPVSLRSSASGTIDIAEPILIQPR